MPTPEADVITADATGDHLTGCMIALMPTPDDADRLAIAGGERAADLHCTLYYLGPDASVWDQAHRDELAATIRDQVESAEFGGANILTASIFGAAHWNAGSDDPSWVWSVGDLPADDPVDGDGDGLEDVRELVTYALENRHGPDDMPTQHTPWVAHICAAYTDDLTLLPELESRLGPVTFDRIRLSFGDQDTDIPLNRDVAMVPTSGDGMTAAAGVLRRRPSEMELASRTDFALMDTSWQSALHRLESAWFTVLHGQQEELKTSITQAVDAGDLATLARLSVSTVQAEKILADHMDRFARSCGLQMQRDAAEQGVHVEWTYDPDTALTASARTVVDRIKAFAAVTSSALASRMTAAASVRASVLAQTQDSGAEVARDVDHDLSDRPRHYVREALAAALTAAQNWGRLLFLRAAPPAQQYVASEILDRSTCGPCYTVDGRAFTGLDAVEAAYPAGGYVECRGGGRCRGTFTAVWSDPFGADQATDDTQTQIEDALSAGATRSERDDAMTDTGTEDLGGKPNQGTKKDKRLKENDAKTKAAGRTLGDEVEAALAAMAAENQDPGVVQGEPGDGSLTAAWEGPIALEGQVTGDGREFAPDSLKWADLPVPLRWNKEDSHGGEPHTVAVNVGRIDEIWRDGSLIMGRGVLDISDTDGQAVHAKIKGQYLRGVSIDADSITDADVEYVWPEDTNASDDEDMDIFDMLFAAPEKIVFHAGRIRAATIVDIPAFAEAYIALTDTDGAMVAGGTPAGQDGAVMTRGVKRRTVDGLVAGLLADPGWTPPAAWFANPRLSVPTGITVTDEGRVYGHAAMWGACHIGQQDVCVQPPREEAHPYYMTGEVRTREGGRVSVGQITVGTGHAPLSYGAVPATEHYDHTGHAVADVTVGNDDHGIWVAGSVRPGADPTMVHALRAAGQVSGDWRRIGRALRLVGLLAVNVPGFPVPKMATRVVASGAVSEGAVQEALVAAGKLTVVHAATREDRLQEAFKLVMDEMAVGLKDRR